MGSLEIKPSGLHHVADHARCARRWARFAWPNLQACPPPPFVGLHAGKCCVEVHGSCGSRTCRWPDMIERPELAGTGCRSRRIAEYPATTWSQSSDDFSEGALWAYSAHNTPGPATCRHRCSLIRRRLCSGNGQRHRAQRQKVKSMLASSSPAEFRSSTRQLPFIPA